MDINQIFNQAITLQINEKLEEAERLYREILKVQSEHLDANNNLGVILEQHGKLEEAEIHYKKAIEFNPNFAEAYNNLGNVLKDLGRFDESLLNCKKCIKLKPNLAQPHNNLGELFFKLKKFEESEASYKKAIELKPDYTKAYNNLGSLLFNLDRIEEAKFNFKKSLETNPEYIEAIYNLGKLTNFTKEDVRFSQMQKLYLSQSLSDKKRAMLIFTLAKACEDLNQLDKSFKYYFEANKIYKKTINYDIKKIINEFSLYKSTCSNLKKNSLKTTKIEKSLKPIFIVGMPRSGTTLIEQIISSHSKVTGAGELDYIDVFGRDIALGISDINNNILLNLKEKYIRKLNRLSNGSLMIIDKDSGNFRYIGLIYSLFPDAKIIHVKRNAAATCWGLFKKKFSREGIKYSYNLDDIVTYYELYQDLMKFWEEKYKSQIYNLNYEKLTENQGEETKKLIKHLGLEWEDACLAPQDNKRVVYTASKMQVKKKIYTGSSDKWKKFEPFLNGVFDHLRGN